MSCIKKIYEPYTQKCIDCDEKEKCRQLAIKYPREINNTKMPNIQDGLKDVENKIVEIGNKHTGGVLTVLYAIIKFLVIAALAYLVFGGIVYILGQIFG